MTVFKGVPQPMQDRILEDPSILKGRTEFAEAIGARLDLKEVTIEPRAKDGKVHATVTYAGTVGEDMMNLGKTLHGGCAAYLIDLCSSVALHLLPMSLGKPAYSVSYTMSMTFHAPVPLGANLEVTSTTVSVGGRAMSAVTEIWDVTNNRLCITSVHNKMAPAPSKPQL